MKKWKENLSIKNVLFGVIALVILLVILVPVALATSPAGSHFEEEEIEGGWTVEASGQVYTDVTLSETMFEMQNKGDVFHFYRQIPEDSHVTNPVLTLHAVHCFVDIYLDDELVSHYGDGSRLEHMLPGYGTMVVQIPNDYAGKMLDIYYYVQEDDSFDGVPAPVIMNATYRAPNMMSRNRINFVVGLFLIVLGFSGMIASAILSVGNRAFRKIFWLSMFTLTISAWTMCNNETMSMFFMNISDKSYLEYIMLYIMILPFLLYFSERVFVKGLAKWIKVYYIAVVSLQSAFFVMTMVLHFTDLISFPHFVSAQHLLLILSLLFYVLLNVAERKFYHKTDWGITIGFIIACALALLELVRYNVEKYLTGFEGNVYSSTLSIAVLVIIITLFIDFMNKVLTALYNDTKNQVLQQMVYLDELTGLANRRHCEELLKKLPEQGKKYAIINLDMNLLKAINDTFGHEAGDRVLVSFAEVLKMVFPQKAEICRMGGDEFAIILTDGDETQVHSYIGSMLDEMERRNADDDMLTLSAAYGCAYSHESDNPYSVFKLADQRMYACKKDMHVGREL